MPMSALLEAEDPRESTERPPVQASIARLTLLQSVRRRPLLAIIPTILLVIAAVALALERDPVYTSEARLIVGRLDLNQPGALGGYATATQAFATTYSRAVGAQEVIQKVSRETGLDPFEIRSRLDATPIPQSPVFRIIAVGSSPTAAISVANGTSDALVDYVKKTNESPNPESPKLLKEFRDYQVDVSRAEQALGAAKRRLEARDTTRSRLGVADAQGRFAAAQLRADAASEAFTQSRTGSSATQGVTILAPATFATNDRSVKLQIYVFVAVIAGVLLGIALAAIVEDRSLRRSLRTRVGEY